MEKNRTSNIVDKLIILNLIISSFCVVGCSKIEINNMEEPSYLRVFNNLRFKITLDDRDLGLSDVVMLIDPEFDNDGTPKSARIIGDFLTTRNTYSPPYPSSIGNSLEKYNAEYPGKEQVMAGPILNGFDLSSWAQVPSGRQRIQFYFRPHNEISFFNLDERYRQVPMLDTVIDLNVQGVYTLHLLQKDFRTKENTILLRKENFHQQAFADSLLYVNFYNMSAKGFVEAHESYKPRRRDYFNDSRLGIKDDVKVYFTLANWKDAYDWNKPIPSFDRNYITSLRRNTHSSSVAPYYGVPVFAGNSKDSIASNVLQIIYFLSPAYNINVSPWDRSDGEGNFGLLTFYGNGKVDPSKGRTFIGTLLPNMIVTTHSGKQNPRSFGTVNTIEVVNGDVYLTTIQRVYEPPVY